MNKNDITLNYAFQEYIPEKDLENKGIKDISRVLTYEEPRWTFKNASEAMNIIKEADVSLYEKIQDYVKEQQLPSENTLYLDFGKSIRYDDEYMVDFSKETLSDKLDNRFIVRYSHDNDDGNLTDGGDEIVINDNETVSLLNGMIEEHVKENIKKYEQYKIKRDSLQKNQTWLWKDYDDLSGHLEAPDGTQYFSYDWTTKEYKVNPENDSWDSFLDADPTRDTSLSAFKEYARNYIKNNIVKDKSLNIVFERNYIDTEKLMEEEEKKMLQNESFDEKYNRMEKLFEGKTSRLGIGEKQNFKELSEWVQEEFPEKNNEEVLLETTSRMIVGNLDFGDFDYQNYDNVYGFGDGAEWRFDFSDTAAKMLVSGEITELADAQKHIYKLSEKAFASLKENPEYKGDIEITDRINSAFSISKQLYPEFAKLYEHDVAEDSFYNYTSKDKKAYIEKVWETLKNEFDNNHVTQNEVRNDLLIIEDITGTKELLLTELVSLNIGRDSAIFGKESLTFTRPNAEQLQTGIENGWGWKEISTGYGVFQDNDYAFEGHLTPEYIAKIDDMEVFESDREAALQWEKDTSSILMKERENMWIGDENYEFYNFPDTPENRTILKEAGWLLEQSLTFDWSDFTEEQFNNLKREIESGRIREDYKGQIHIGSISADLTVYEQEEGFVSTDYYIAAEEGDGEMFDDITYGEESEGITIPFSIFKENDYEVFKKMFENNVLNQLAEDEHLKREASRPLVDWGNEEQVKELYHTKLIESAKLNEIVIAPYSREKRDVETVRDFVSKIINLPAIGVPDDMVYAVLDNIGRVQDDKPGDFLKVKKDGSLVYIMGEGNVTLTKPIDIIHEISTFAEEHAALAEEGSEQKKDFEYIKTISEKVAESIINPKLNPTEYVLNKLKEKGIEVVTDKNEFDNILADIEEKNITLKMLNEKPECLQKISSEKSSELNDGQDAASAISTPNQQYHIMFLEENQDLFFNRLDDLDVHDTNAEEFYHNLRKVFGIDEPSKRSGYVLQQIGEDYYKLRISNHSVMIRNRTGTKTHQTSIVIKLAEDKRRTNEKARVIEYVYNPENLTAEKMSGIISGIKDWIKTGVFTDKNYDEHFVSHAELINGKIEIVPSSKVQKMTAAEYLNMNLSKVHNFIIDEITYGFTYEGKIYLNPEIMNSEVAVHEYTHLWDNLTRKDNLELWNKGLHIFKGTSIWNEVVNDINYADIKDDENLVLSECHARITGKVAEVALRKIAELDGTEKQADMIDWDKKTIDFIYANYRDVFAKNGFDSVAEFAAASMKELFNPNRVIDSYNESINYIKEQLEKKSGIKVNERLVDEIYSRYEERDLQLEPFDNGLFRITDTIDGKYTNLINIQDVVKQVITWDDKELSELHDGTDDEEEIKKIKDYIEDLEHVNEQITYSHALTNLDFNNKEDCQKVKEMLGDDFKLTDEEAKVLLSYATHFDDGTHEYGLNINGSLYFRTNQDNEGWSFLTEDSMQMDFLTSAFDGAAILLDSDRSNDIDLLNSFLQKNESLLNELDNNRFYTSSLKDVKEKIKEIDMATKEFTVTHSVTFPCGFIYPDSVGKTEREMNNYRKKVYKKLQEKYGFNDNDAETSHWTMKNPKDSSFNINFAVSVPEDIKTDENKVNAWIDEVEKFTKEECGCTFINWEGGERFEQTYINEKQYRMQQERNKDFANPDVENLKHASIQDIKDYCKLNSRIELTDEQVKEIYTFYDNNDQCGLYVSSAGNLYVRDEYEDKIVSADAELLKAGNNLRTLEGNERLDYLLYNISDDIEEWSKGLLDQLSNDSDERLRIVSDVLSKSFATLDRHDSFWKVLLDYGANPTRAIRIAAEDANLGDNLNWLLNNVPESQIKQIFSDNGYADAVFDIAKESVTHDMDSWIGGHDIGFTGFKRIARLCGREADADRYYGELLEKAFEYPVKPKIAQLLDIPELLAEKMNNSKVHQNEPSISRDQASSILDYCNYEDIMFYVAKDGKVYSLDVSEDYNGEGLEESNFGIVANGIEYARKAQELDYSCYSTESFNIVSDLWQKERQFSNPSVENKKNTFTNDIDKMRDFDSLSKDEFLASYSYLTEEEYDATLRELKENNLTGMKMVERLQAQEKTFSETETQLPANSKEPVEIIKEIATQKELAEVPELFTNEFKNRMKTRLPGPEKNPFIVAKAIINDWKTSKPDYIPALNKWLSESLKKEGFTTKEDLEKGFEKFFKKLSSSEQKRMQYIDFGIGEGR